MKNRSGLIRGVNNDKDNRKPAKTMEFREAWTSGKPLLGENSSELLQLALNEGYRTITITFHGLIDGDLNLKPHNVYPIKGVFKGSDFEKVHSIIQEFNNTQKLENRFRLGAGITLGTHNSSKESLIRYVKYFNKLGIDALRFNSFTDHSRTHKELPLSDEETKRLYRDILWVYKNISLNFQLGISEDIGTEGIDILGLPSHVGWCRAGRQLFAIMPTPYNYIISENSEVIGILVGCVNIFEPELGRLLRITNALDGSIDYSLEFDEEKIEEFNNDRKNGRYKNGCFAKEILKETPPLLVREVKQQKDKIQVETKLK